MNLVNKNILKEDFTMKKKLLALFMATCMVMGLAACGASDSSTSGDAASDPGTTSEASADAGDDASASGDLITVGFSQVGAESDWRTANSTSMKDTFTEENGYELIFDDAQQKQENQIAAIRNFIQQEVDYIVLAPVTETGWDAVLQEASDAGIPVIIVDRMVDVSDDSLYTAWVGSNFQLEGDKAAEWLNQYLQANSIENANIVNIQGTIGASAQIGRTAGLEEACEANSNMTLLAETTGEFTQAKGQEVMESFLKQYDDINVVWCENDNEAFGAIDAIEAAGKTVGSDIANGEIMVMSFDTVNAGISLTMEGKITLDTECNPLHGPRVQSIIEQLEAGETPDKTAYVDEGVYAHDDTVKSVTVDGTDYEVTPVTQEVIDGRQY